MNIAVRSPNWIGDCIMSLPALRALKENCPGDNIFLVSKQNRSEIYENIRGIKEIITIPNKFDGMNFFETVKKLRKYNFKTGILFTNSFSSALLFRLSGINKLTGYNKDLRWFLLKKRRKFPGKKNKKHQVLFYIELIEDFLGKKLREEYSDELSITTDEKKRVIQLLSKLGLDLSKPIIGISPYTAYGSAKEWLPERFRELIHRIRKEREECEILLFGSREEREKIAKIVEEVKDNKIYNLAGINIREAIASILLCKVFISNDSGTMHIASSLNIPLVAIFGPTMPHKTSPSSRGTKVLYHPVECAPCKYRKCPVDHKCMQAITVNEVYMEVKNKIPKT